MLQYIYSHWIHYAPLVVAYWPRFFLHMTHNNAYLNTEFTVWISNHIDIKLWYVIIHLCHNFNGGLAKLSLKLWHGWVIRSHTNLWVAITFPCLTIWIKEANSEYQCSTDCFSSTPKRNLESFWHCHHRLHRKLSKWQLPLEPVSTMSSKCHFSVTTLCSQRKQLTITKRQNLPSLTCISCPCEEKIWQIYNSNRYQMNWSGIFSYHEQHILLILYYVNYQCDVMVFI